MKTNAKNKGSCNNPSLSLQDRVNIRSASAYDKIELKTKINIYPTKNESILKKSRIISNVCDYDQLLKIKQEYNKKVIECNTLKIDNLHLEEEIKKNNKTIEEVLKEVSRVCPDIYNIVNNHSIYEGNLDENNSLKPASSNNINNNSNQESSDYTVPQTKLSLNPVTLLRLKDIYKINNLKKQVNSLKLTLQMREDDISSLKNSSKISKYHILENDYITKVEDFMSIKNSYDNLKDNYSNKETKLKEVSEEKDYYKSMMIKIKGNYDEARERLRFIIEENNKNTEINKALEEKINSIQFTTQSLKFKMSQKDIEINNLKDELKNLDNFKLEKSKFEKKLSDCTNTINTLKEEIEKNQKYRDTERSLNSQKSKIEEEFESKIVVLNKKIKILENDAFQYREKIKNLDSQLTQKKIIVLSNNNQKVINNTNEPNDDNNEKNIISSLNEKLEFEITKNKILEEKIQKLKTKKNNHKLELRKLINDKLMIEQNKNDIQEKKQDDLVKHEHEILIKDEKSQLENNENNIKVKESFSTENKIY